MAARCVGISPEIGRAFAEILYTIPYHVWYIDLPERLKLMVNVGKYTWMLWVWRLGGFTPQSFWNKILTFDSRICVQLLFVDFLCMPCHNQK